MNGIPVLVVEDHDVLREVTVDFLVAQGYDATGVHDGIAMDALLRERLPSILVLDLNLPGEDGLSICRRLRAAHPHLGVIMLTARNGLQDRIAGHDSGADHYLCKPVDSEELLAVMRSLERRLGETLADDWVLHYSALTITPPGGEPLALTGAEAHVLRSLARGPGRQATRREIVEGLGENWYAYDERRLEAIVSRLRRKLSDATGKDAPLRALRGMGYGFLEGLRQAD